MADDRLTIQIDDFDNKIASIYTRFDTDPQFQREFLEDPTTVLGTHFTGKTLRKSEIDIGNQLMLSALSNPGFVEWSKKFERRFRRRLNRKRSQMNGTEQQILQSIVDDMGREQLMEELAEGIIATGDPEIVSLILDREPAQTPVNGPTSPVTFFIVIVVAFLLAVAVPVLAAPGLNRQDIQRISRMLTQSLREKDSSGFGGPGGLTN